MGRKGKRGGGGGGRGGGGSGGAGGGDAPGSSKQQQPLRQETSQEIPSRGEGPVMHQQEDFPSLGDNSRRQGGRGRGRGRGGSGDNIEQIRQLPPNQPEYSQETKEQPRDKGNVGRGRGRGQGSLQMQQPQQPVQMQQPQQPVQMQQPQQPVQMQQPQQPVQMQQPQQYIAPHPELLQQINMQRQREYQLIQSLQAMGPQIANIQHLHPQQQSTLQESYNACRNELLACQQLLQQLSIQQQVVGPQGAQSGPQPTQQQRGPPQRQGQGSAPSGQDARSVAQRPPSSSAQDKEARQPPPAKAPSQGPSRPQSRQGIQQVVGPQGAQSGPQPTQQQSGPPQHQGQGSAPSGQDARSVAQRPPPSSAQDKETRQPPPAKTPSQGPSRPQSHQGKSEPPSSSTGTGQVPRRLDRPKKTKAGRKIIVETNHLELKLKNPKMVVHHYDVTVNPEKPFRFYRRALDAVREICYPSRFPAFDGKKNLYSYPELPLRSKELVETVNIYDEEKDQTKEITVTIKYANAVDVSIIGEYLRCGTTLNTPQEAIQALDVVLRQPSARRLVTVGRSFFSPPPGRIISLGDGLDLWYGFFQSAIIGWKPFLNIDVAHKGFPTPENCVAALKNIIRSRDGELEHPNFQLQGYQRESFLSYIKNLKVVYAVPHGRGKRTYKVIDLSKCPRDNKFKSTDKTTQQTSEMTVEKYFLSQYRYKLNYPHLPCLAVGSKDRPISLPLELCTIAEGQVTMKKMNEIQTRNMVQQAAVDTDRRKEKIMDSIKRISFNNDPCVKEFGLSVSESFTRVDARVLMPPKLDYSEKMQVDVKQGVWRNEKFLQGAELLTWRILNTNRYIRDNDIRGLAEGLIKHGKTCGMNISNNYGTALKDKLSDIKDYFTQCQKDGVSLVIIILPDRGAVTYGGVKKCAELQVGILTQCLKSFTVQKKLSSATFVNILQKVNAKLNGVNHSITQNIWPSYFHKPVIVVGADVTHPSPDQVNIPSIAAVAASHDVKAFKYNMIWRLQPPREEVIKDLQAIMKDHLLKFYLSTKQKPLAILFYRDGVSEGQFKIVRDIELNAIRRACSSLDADYKPPITFFVVQKRHHTRFFPTSPKDAEGRNKNVPAGTVVDTEITHPTELDFYLVSHASIQGTARPTKYHLLWDDAELSEQELEEITFYLCHLFTRCTRSVSYPAPTYYAHLAAFRARSYMETEHIHLERLEEEQKRRIIKDTFIKKNPMFFV